MTNPLQNPEMYREEKTRNPLSAPSEFGGGTDYERFKAQAEPLPDEPGILQQAWQGVKDYATGANAEPGVTDLPEFSVDALDGDFSDKFTLAFRKLLNSTEEGKAEAIKSMFPDVNLEQDAYGNMIVVLPTGDRRTINRPGPSPHDAYQFVTELMTFLGPARLLRTAKAPTMVGRAGAETSVAGGLEYGRSAVSPDEDADVSRALIAAGGAGFGQVIGDAFSKVFLRGPKVQQAGKLTDAARQALEDAGINPLDVSTAVADRFIKDWAAQAHKYGVSPSTARRVLLDEFNIKTTRAPVTNDMKDWRTEDAMARGGKGDAAQNIMRTVRDAEAESVGDAVANIVGRQAPDIGNRVEAGEAVQAGLKKRSESALASINRAYDKENIPTGELFVSGEYVATIPDRIRRRLYDEDVDVSPAALKLIPQTEDAIRQLDSFVAEGTEGMAKGDVFLHDIHRLEKQRRFINRKFAAAQGEDRTALAILKSEYDRAIGDFIDEGLFQGDAAIFDKLKDARKLRAEYGRLFEVRGKRDEAGKFIQKIIEEGRTPEEVGQYITTSANLSSESMGRASRIAERIVAIAGKDSPEVKALKAGVIRAVVQNQAMTQKGYKTMARDMSNFANSRLGKNLFEPSELSEVRRFARAVSILVPPKDAVNHSGSAGAFMGMVLDMMTKLPMFVGVAMGDPMMAAAGAVAATGRRQASEAAGGVRASRAATGAPRSTRRYLPFGSVGAAGGSTIPSEER